MTNISKLIEDLQQIQRIEGDLSIYIFDDGYEKPFERIDIEESEKQFNSILPKRITLIGE